MYKLRNACKNWLLSGKSVAWRFSMYYKERGERHDGGKIWQQKNTITVQPFERRNKMQLNIATDYAIRIVIYMAKQRRIVSSRELSENLKISQPFIYKIMRKLNHAGILAINTGNSWRVYFAKKRQNRLIYSRLWIPWKEPWNGIDALRMTGIAAVLQQRHVVWEKRTSKCRSILKMN